MDLFHTPVGFPHLPPEMKQIIFSHLDVKTLKSARLVSREWKAMVEDDMKFKVVLSDETFENVRRLDDDWPIHTLVVKNFQKTDVHKSFTRSGLAKRVNGIVLGPGISFPGDSRRQAFPPYTVTESNPREADINYGCTGISERNLKILLNCNPYIESLKVTGSAFKGLDLMPRLNGIKLECLTHLELNYGHFPWVQKMPKNTIEPYVSLLKNSYPSLQTLKYSSTAFKADMRLYVSLLQCIASHSATLKHVKVFHSTVYHLPQRYESGNWFNSKKYDELKAQLEKVRLEHLVIDLVKCGPNFGRRWKDLESAFLRSQTSIRSLTIIVNGRSSSDWDMKGILNGISDSVQDLELHLGCYCDPVFHCSMLANCQKLRNVTVQVVRTVYGVVLGSTPTAKMFKSIDGLPKGIQKLRLSHVVHDDDIDWISRNMSDLEEITFGYLLHSTHADQVIQLFLRLIGLPKLKQFRVTNHHCDELDMLAMTVPGIVNLSHGADTNIRINRSELVISPKVIKYLRALGFQD